MEAIEIEVPNYHPKGCSCAICQACEAVLNELEANHARIAELERALGKILYANGPQAREIASATLYGHECL